MSQMKFAIWTLLSGAAGALLSAACFHAYVLRTDPIATHDGLYPLPFMFLLPLGWLIGAGLFGLWALAKKSDIIPPGGCTVFVLILIAGVPVCYFLLMHVVWLLVEVLDRLIPHRLVT